MAHESEAIREFLDAHQPQKAPWTNGEVIKVESLKKFHELEEDIISYLPHPYAAEDVWPGRKPAEQIVTPKGFYGRICDISLVFTDQPYEFMNERYAVRGNASLSDTTDTDGFALGFAMQAILHSSKGGNIGTLHTFFAYAHTPIYKNRGNIYFQKDSGAGLTGIRRVVAKPTIVTETPIETLRERSITTALALQKSAVLHPYLGAFESKRGKKK